MLGAEGSTVRIDLHLHSTASDGSLSPSALVCAARTGGLHIIALTDHDTAAGVTEAGQAGAGSMHVIPGIEVSTTHARGDVHVLGYFIDPAHPRLAAYMRDAEERRRERMRSMLGRLGDMGVRVPFEEVIAAAGPAARTLGRPHLARALISRGYAQTHAEAFDRFIGDHGPAYAPVDLASPQEAIELIHAAGGIAVWAHPRLDVFLEEIDRFIRWGLDGVECYRPRCDPADSLRLESYARSHGLLVTGGSDWHGSWHGRLGAFSVGPEEVGAFLERGGI
jgi:predicted metal-dependent phosphoesterase TrpH